MSTLAVWTEAEIDVFFAGYLATALWSSTDDDGEALDAIYQVSDIASATIAEQRDQVEDFITANAEDLAGLKPTEAGHLFWLNRNGHGAGFWDRGLGERGDRLSAASKVYGSVDLYVGDDGWVYGS